MRLIGSLMLSLGVALACVPVLADEADGLNLARAVYDRPDGADFVSRAKMVLVEVGRQPRERRLYSYAADKGSGQRWSLMRFVEPADVEGTGLLTIDYPGAESDQWLYLPALDRVRRIASSRKGGRFVGSDFVYEDLRDREPEMDRHTLAGQSKIGKVPCDLLESVPVDLDNSVYTKRISCIHRPTLTPLQIEFFKGRGNKPVKRLKARRLKKIQGYWTVLESEMEDLESGHTTRLVTEAIKYDQGLPDGLFTRQALADDSRERSYRP
jgi:hypothetical protein